MGEWFIGSILVVYLYFPLVKKVIDKIPKVAWLFILFIYIFFVLNYSFEMPVVRNPVARILDITFGIYYAKYVIAHERRSSIIRMIAFGVSLFVFASYCAIYIYCQPYNKKVNRLY